MTPRKKVTSRKKARPIRSRTKKPLLAYRHAEADRVNLPTDQTERFQEQEKLAAVPFSPEVRAPEGPRLSWRRSEGLDDLTTKAGPLFVHEKVAPAAFAAQVRGAPSRGLFDDFNGLPKDAAWSCYTHRGNWQNRIIRGDSRDVMASLAGKEDLAGKVQMIFWDPPYGINFKAGYQPSTRKRAGGAPSEAAATTAFRDTYRDGVHSYLDAVYRTAVLGRALLKESGSFFMQISSVNLHRCALVLDEVFGPENRVATIAFAKTGASSSAALSEVTDYLLCYGRDCKELKFRQIYDPLDRAGKIDLMSSWARVELPDGTRRRLTRAERQDPDGLLPVGSRAYQRMRVASMHESKTGRSGPVVWNGVRYNCPPGEQWRVSMEGMGRLDELGRLDGTASGSQLTWMRFEDEVPGRRVHNVWTKQMRPSDMHYVVETAESVIERCILMATDPGDLVLDPTCGSGTTAFVAEKWGRRWITIDASAIPVALARQRLVSGIHDWFLTQDDPEGAREEARLSGVTQNAPPPLRGEGQKQKKPPGTDLFDPASGFVYERVPKVSAASLAYDHPPKATLLVDRPLRKKGWKRLAAPFTVESHSPWRYEPVAGGASESRIRTTIRERVLESLGSAGFPTGDGSARWHLDDLESWPLDSTALTHEGRVRETGDRVALVILSDDQTASRKLLDLAAEEAAGRSAMKKLIVAAFEYEADAPLRQRRGRLEILCLRANRDLAIAELKPGKRDHAFAMVGEPEIEIRQVEEKNAGPGSPPRFEVEVRGWNTYDPATGQVRAGKPGDVDCWLLDTDHDGQAFFARRIHFPGKRSDRQLKRFRSALARRIEPHLWDTMLSLTSGPFPRPKSGRIAVRIITTTGDEMLAVRAIP